MIWKNIAVECHPGSKQLELIQIWTWMDIEMGQDGLTFIDFSESSTSELFLDGEATFKDLLSVWKHNVLFILLIL